MVALLALPDKKLQAQVILASIERGLCFLVSLAVLESLELLQVQLTDLGVVEPRQEPEAPMHCFGPLRSLINALGRHRRQIRLQCVVVKGRRILELIDLASQVFDLIPGVDFALLKSPPRVDQLAQVVDLRLDRLHVTLLEDVVDVLGPIELLLCALLAHNQVFKRRLTDGNLYQFLAL